MVQLKQLWVKNFRNYFSEEIQFHSGTNVIFGVNGQGKTNLLEAIQYLGSGTSFRGSPAEALIQKNHDTAVVRAEITHDDRLLLVEAEISNLRQNSIAIN